MFGVSDGDIYVFFDSDIKGYVFHLLAVLPEFVEAVLEDEPIVDIAKLNGRHIRLHQVSIVVDIVLPCFEN